MAGHETKHSGCITHVHLLGSIEGPVYIMAEVGIEENKIFPSQKSFT